MASPTFDDCIFINCPLDEEYEPILQAILFCIIYLGFTPRISTERGDSAENRLSKILELIEGSKYSIHDLSRAQAREEGEFYRLNMPFELGLDYACRRYFGKGRQLKKILILEEKRYRHHASISDLAGCDIEIHSGDFEQAIRKVRNWLVGEAGKRADGAGRINTAYVSFQGWHYKRQLAAGFSEDDIQDYPTKELLAAMDEWVAAGKPV